MALNPNGCAGQIAALKPGESFSISKRIPLNSKQSGNETKQAREYLKNRISPAVARAREQTGHAYTTETTVGPTYDYGAMIVTAVVTRLPAIANRSLRKAA